MDKNLKVAIILSAVDKASAVLNKAFLGAETKAKRLKEVGETLNGFGEMLAGAAITEFFKKTVEDARDGARAIRVMDAAYSNLGKRGAEIAKQGQEFAENYQLKIGVKDEDIEAVETKFAPFQRMFTESAMQANLLQRATKLAFDMQASGFGDAAQNAAKLGKLMNDPVNNINAMAKVLGKVDAATKQHIVTLLAHNKLTEAQEYVLGSAEKKFNKNGSAAEAAADAGDRFEIAMHKISVQIGNSLLPELSNLANRFLAYLPTIEAFVSKHKSMIKYIGEAGIALLVFGTATSGIKIIVQTLMNVFTLGGYAIKGFSFLLKSGGTIAALAVKGFDALKFGLFALRYALQFSVLPALKAAGTAIVDFGATLLASPVTWFVAAAIAIGVAAYLIYKNWDKIAVWFKNLWAKTKVIFTQAWEGIKNLFLNYTPQGLIIKHWDKIAAWFSGLWMRVKQTFTGWVTWVMGLGVKFVDAGKNIALSIWKGIKSMAHKPIEAIEEMTQKLRDYLPFSPAKTGPLRDIHRVKIIETIAQSMKPAPAITAMRYAVAGIYNEANMPATRPVAGSSPTFHFSPTINLHGGATEKDAKKLTREMKELLTVWWREMQANNSRTGFNH